MSLMTLEAILCIIAFLSIYFVYLLCRKRLSTVIEIEIEPDIVHFRTKGKELNLKPILYISKSGKAWKNMSVNEVFDDGTLSEEIHLFEDRLLSQNVHQKRHCFESFFRYAFEQLLKRKYFLFASVSLKRFDIMKKVFHKEHKKELWKVLKMAGAIECHFNH